MNDLPQLEQRIREKLSAAAEKRLDRQAEIAAEMQSREERLARFNGEAQRWMTSVVRPRMTALAACFENARLRGPDAARPLRCVCDFDRNAQFPATTSLELAIFPDTSLEMGVVAYGVEILPILFQFEKKDQLALPLDGSTEAQLAAWVDHKLIAFVDTYLQLGEVEHYQRDNLVVDPVCGMQINKQFAAASAELRGKTYFFCVEDCRRKFLEDMDRYVAPPRGSS